ncbi:hypothetical protein ACO0RG_003774 [Hanseniaspora osmophila]
MTNQSDKIVILGAGVIGLSVCHQLLLDLSTVSKRKTKPSIKIVAKHFPLKDINDYTSEYTSPWAGAHFRPFPHRLNVDDVTYSSDKRESGYTRETMNFFHANKKYLEQHASSVQIMKGQDFLENPTPEYVNLLSGYNSASLDGFKQATPPTIASKTETARISFGYEYNTFCLNAPEYLNFLMQEIKKLSIQYDIPVEFVNETVSCLKYASAKYEASLVFNCSGLGMAWDSATCKQDPNCYKIRGQTLLVDVPSHYTSVKSPYDEKTITYQTGEKDWTFVIKRPDPQDPYNSLKRKFIIGGTKQPFDCQTTPRASDTAELIFRAKKLFPDLLDPATGEFKIAKINVGFRPARTGGSKVDLQYCRFSNDSKPVGVVNCYGFGGMGFECSVGAAKHSIELYHQYIRQAKL